MNLIDSLIKEGWLKTPGIIEAFRKIKRVDFLPPFAKATGGKPEDLAELNQALPIGYGQTISQPLTVAFMLEQLEPKAGDKILDVGSGSGWTSALLGELVGPKGMIIAVEAIPELKEFGERNAAKYNLPIKFICADGSRGYERESPYDKILCSASAQKEVPLAWREQVKIGGRIVTPVGSSIWLLIKKADREFEEVEYPGFSFVPLIEK